MVLSNGIEFHWCLHLRVHIIITRIRIQLNSPTVHVFSIFLFNWTDFISYLIDVLTLHSSTSSLSRPTRSNFWSRKSLPRSHMSPQVQCQWYFALELYSSIKSGFWHISLVRGMNLTPSTDPPPILCQTSSRFSEI